jgi:hypothetical protein
VNEAPGIAIFKAALNVSNTTKAALIFVLIVLDRVSKMPKLAF